MPKEVVDKTKADTVDIKIDQISNLERSLTIVVPVSQIEQEEEKAFRKLSQQAEIKGYRKGKAPLSMLKKLYGESVHEDVIKQLANKNLSEAIQKNDLHPVGGIQIDSLDSEPGKPLTLKAKFEVSPKIELADLSGLELERFKIEISEEDIHHKVEDLRARQATWLPVQEAAKQGNQVKIDYEGTLDGKSFPGGSNQNFDLEIGKEVMIADFENKLLGAKAGDSLSFDVTFPKDYGIKTLEGKKAHFNVKVHEVSVKQLPELDDNFAKRLDVQEGLDALKQKLKTFMEEESHQVIYDHLKHQIVEQLIEKHPAELPKSLVEQEIRSMQARVKQQFSDIIKEGTFPDMPSEYFEKQAKKKIAISLVFSELIQKYQMKPDQARLQKKIESMTSAYNVNAETLMEWLKNNEGAQQQLTFAVLEDQVIDKVLEQAKIKEKPVSYREAIKWKAEEEDQS